MTTFSKHIDWLACTFTHGRLTPHAVIDEMTWRKDGVGKHGYTVKYSAKETTAWWENEPTQVSMGAHLTMTGQAMSYIREYPIPERDFVTDLIIMGARFSRLDLAVNIHGGSLTPDKFKQALKSGKLTAKSTSYLWVTGNDDSIEGSTLYLGSRTSDRMMRIYDKNAQQGISDAPAWVRLEMELKGERAMNAAKSIEVNGVTATVNGHFQDFLQDPENQELHDALTGNSAPVTEIGRPVSNTEAWLINTCSKSLARVLVDNPEFRRAFDATVDMWLASLTTPE